MTLHCNFHLAFASLISSVPNPYNNTKVIKEKGIKNSNGGDDPDNISANIEERSTKNKIILISFFIEFELYFLNILYRRIIINTTNTPAKYQTYCFTKEDIYAPTIAPTAKQHSLSAEISHAVNLLTFLLSHLMSPILSPLLSFWVKEYIIITQIKGVIL